MQVTDAMVAKALEAYDAAVPEDNGASANGMEAALTAALAEMWRPIDAKAKNGDDYLVYNEEWDWTFGAVQVARWEDGAWQFQSEMCLDDEDVDGQPTHFMPLPPPPMGRG